MDKLLRRRRGRTASSINAADLTGRKAGDNPHLWYEPATMPAVAKAHRRRARQGRRAHMRPTTPRGSKTPRRAGAHHAARRAIEGQTCRHAVTATEPVFGLMAEALGLTMRNERFQLAVMNDTEPSARDVAAFETRPEERKVKAADLQQAR